MGELLDLFKALIADYVLHTAGVFHGDLLVHTETDEPVGKNGMTLVHGLGNFQTFFCQSDKAADIFL